MAMKRCCDCSQIPIEIAQDSEQDSEGRAIVWCKPLLGGCGRLTKSLYLEEARKRWDQEETDDFQ